MNVTFLNTKAAYLLLLIVPFALIHLRGMRERRKAMEMFAQKELLPGLVPPFNRRRYASAIIVLASAVLCIAAIMRPRLISALPSVTEQKGLNIIFAIDTSKSMLAQDIKPDRLGASKELVRGVVKGLKGDRVGLIAFSGTSFLLCPLTGDYNLFLNFLNDLDAGTIDSGGSSIAAAVHEGIKGLQTGEKGTPVLILLTDGEDHSGDYTNAALKAQKAGIRIFTIGAGTSRGGIIPLSSDRNGYLFAKDREGNVVKSSLNDAALRAISEKTGGRYASISETSPNMIGKNLEGLEKGTVGRDDGENAAELFQVPLLLALLLLFAEPFVWSRE